MESSGPTNPTPAIPPPTVWYREEGTAAFSSGFYRWLGLALLAAFFLPVIGPDALGAGTRVLFINIEGLFQTDPSGGMLKVQLLYPLIAGVAVLVLAGNLPQMSRSVWLLVLGVMPFILLFSSAEVRRGFEMGFEQMTQGRSPILGGVIGLIAFAGLFAGSRARALRPSSAAAAVLGAVGGGMFILSLFLTTPAGEMSLVQPFTMLFGERPRGMSAGDSGVVVFMALVAIVHMLCLIGSSILCLINASTTRTDAGPRAALAFRLWVWSMLVLLVGFSVGLVIALSEGVPAEAAMPAVTMIVKMLIWIAGLMLLALAGLTEVIVSGSPEPAPPMSALPETVYPPGVAPGPSQPPGQP
jgi:hypothetical protein